MHPELALAVADEAVELDERSRVQQKVESLPRKELPTLVLAIDGTALARMRSRIPQLRKPGQLRRSRVVRHPSNRQVHRHAVSSPHLKVED